MSVCLSVIYSLVKTYIFWDRQELWRLCFLILRYWNVLINSVGTAMCLRKHRQAQSTTVSSQNKQLLAPSWFARKLKYRSGNGSMFSFFWVVLLGPWSCECVIPDERVLPHLIPVSMLHKKYHFEHIDVEVTARTLLRRILIRISVTPPTVLSEVFLGFCVRSRKILWVYVN